MKYVRSTEQYSIFGENNCQSQGHSLSDVFKQDDAFVGNELFK